MSRHLQLLDFWGCSPEKVPNQQELRVERSQVPHTPPLRVGLGWAFPNYQLQKCGLKPLDGKGDGVASTQAQGGDAALQIAAL